MIRGRRISILYPGPSAARFEWPYYFERHLPLAVGTSQRHTRISYCDLDMPLAVEPGIHCICVLHFATDERMGEFERLFPDHPDARPVIADQINYTDMTPVFVAADSVLLGDGRRTDFRVRVVLPPAGREASGAELARLPAVVDALGLGAAIRRRELDVVREPNGAPECRQPGGIATFYVDDVTAAQSLAVALRRSFTESSAASDLASATVIASRVAVFDIESLDQQRGGAKYHGS